MQVATKWLSSWPERHISRIELAIKPVEDFATQKTGEGATRATQAFAQACKRMYNTASS
jgi:hypothetical protein